MASPLIIDLYFLILQYLYENNCHEAAHKMEQESKVFFNTTCFKRMILNAKWDEAEDYLQSFTVPEDNQNSMTMFLIIGRQKYLEALDESNHVKAIDIFDKNLRFLLRDKPHMSEKLIDLLPLNNFRENQEFSRCGNTQMMRAQLVRELNNLIKTNPRFHQKLSFPHVDRARLQVLIVQSLQWQHYLCGNNGVGYPVTGTLFVDHRCPSHFRLQQRRARAANEPIDEAGPSTSRPGDRVEQNSLMFEEKAQPKQTAQRDP